MNEDSTLRSALDHVVLFKTDAEKEGLELAQQYTVTGYPTFALLSADGEVIDRWAGYGTPDAFIGTLDAALADPILMTDRVARYAEHASAKDADVLARYHSTRDEYVESVALLHEAKRLSANEDEGEYDYRIFTDTAFGFMHGVVGQGDTLFTKQEVLDAADALFAAPGIEEGTILSAAQLMQMIAGQCRDPSVMIPYVERAVERTEGATDAGLRRAREGLLVDYMLYVEGDTARAVELEREQMSDGWTEDPSALNSFAWWCFENDINLEEAESLARKGVELAEPGPSKAMILDTLAEICHARGKTGEALELMREAIAEAPAEEHYRRQVTRFEELVGSEL